MPILRWYCAELQRHHEGDAFQHLRRAGFEAFVPLTTVERTHARRTRIVDVPTLPGYGFVRFDTGRTGWQAVWRTPYVKSVLGQTAERPTPIPEKVMDGLRRLKRGDDPRPILAPLAAIPEGATVAFLDGAWADHRGVCVISDDGRMKIAIELFGRMTLLDADPLKLRVLRLKGESHGEGRA